MLINGKMQELPPGAGDDSLKRDIIVERDDA
jgi:hypothetical protein